MPYVIEVLVERVTGYGHKEQTWHTVKRTNGPAYVWPTYEEAVDNMHRLYDGVIYGDQVRVVEARDGRRN